MLHVTRGDEVRLQDDVARSEVVIVPARGAIVTHFRVAGRELLYLDEATLADSTKNVRGGIPLLFPSPGKLEGDRFTRGAAGGAMKQHGFARELPWAVRDTGTNDAAFATVALDANARTLAAYPWEFAAQITFSLRAAVLRLDIVVENRGAEAMPFAFGTHPYFLVRDKAAARIATRATRAFDNVTKKVGPFSGFDLTASEVDLHLLDHGSSSSELTWGDGSALAIRASSEFGRWVVWTLAGKDFVCLEPWTAPGNALNTGESLLTLPPGGSHPLWNEMEYRAS